MVPLTFERGRLSVREDAILELAIEGLTDTQIALRLDITQSTVNSYWVRIRGKLGQLSRTELVALALKQKAQDEMDVANAELAELREAVHLHQRQTQDFSHSDIYRAALDAMPEPVLVCCHRGLIQYANSRLEDLFGYEREELVGLSVLQMVPVVRRSMAAAKMAEYIENPIPVRIGIHQVLYGQRRNGTQFRVVLLIDSRPSTTGLIFSVIVRDFSSEIETRRSHLSGWTLT